MFQDEEDRKPPDRQRILIIDDDDVLRETLGEITTAAGYDVTALGEGKRFLETVSRLRPHCIVMDLSIPDCDGIALLNGLAEEGCSVPIVVVSSHPPSFLDRVRQLAAARGLDIRAALQKPFSVDQFLGAIAGARS
ncbi:MAG: response regulator [Alphaproteobacteria bacterium]|nr:response regulator [Alphaproteobacteria bacterium]